MPINILIADDHSLFRKGIANLLSETENITIVAEAENGQEAVDKAREFNPDVVIMDIGMPVLNGVKATAKLLAKMPQMKVIALSMHTDTHYVREMLEAGASGYLFKNCDYKELITAIETVFAGKKYLNGQITEMVIQGYLGKKDPIGVTEAELTGRESEIFKLLAEGKSVREIADSLFVSVKTVGTHRQNILDKLNLKTTTDLIKYALKKGIISLD